MDDLKQPRLRVGERGRSRVVSIALIDAPPGRCPRRRSPSRSCARNSDAAGGRGPHQQAVEGFRAGCIETPRRRLRQHDRCGSGSRLDQHTIIADHRRFELLRLVEAALGAAALERREGVEARDGLRAVVDQMTERPVAQPEHQIADLGRRLGVQLAEDAFDKPLIFLGPFRLDAVAGSDIRCGMA